MIVLLYDPALDSGMVKILSGVNTDYSLGLSGEPIAVTVK